MNKKKENRNKKFKNKKKVKKWLLQIISNQRMKRKKWIILRIKKKEIEITLPIIW